MSLQIRLLFSWRARYAQSKMFPVSFSGLPTSQKDSVTSWICDIYISIEIYWRPDQSVAISRFPHGQGRSGQSTNSCLAYKSPCPCLTQWLTDSQNLFQNYFALKIDWFDSWCQWNLPPSPQSLWGSSSGLAAVVLPEIHQPWQDIVFRTDDVWQTRPSRRQDLHLSRTGLAPHRGRWSSPHHELPPNQKGRGEAQSQLWSVVELLHLQKYHLRWR